MSSDVVRVNGTDVTTSAPDRTVINITINQGSSLAYLMESVKSLGNGIGSLGAKTVSVPRITVSKGEQKALGVVQIIVGSIFFAFGILICFVPSNPLNWNGVLFWTGIPFILSGVVSVLTERRPTRCWLLLSPWMNLLSFAVAIAGIVFHAGNLRWWRIGSDWLYKERCEVRRSYRVYEPTSSYDNVYDEDKWRVNECKELLRSLMIFDFGVNIILMVLMVLMLCITFFSVGYGWKVLCCGKSSRQGDGVQADQNTESLLAAEAHPPPYEEKIGNVETV
ncbi:transmembrane protein 176B isoform X2 [Microcaecilia unicolor]|uniref:Transmembrane protein 176B-like isoform X2 n=1 Tax=Microcaecilia unicolor TaxID=1415580 RepID=A0A6P7ZEY3_9AMPH|nr:transmembrane protein 176B-like isoform X2 [Microcaecilia unicolor]